MSNVKKTNQHLENLIKHEDFEKLPVWYRHFVKKLMLLSQQTQPTAIYQLSDYLSGFVAALYLSNVINGLFLDDLVVEARYYAIKNNVKKAA